MLAAKVIALRLDTIGELLASLWKRKLWWLIPIVAAISLVLLVMRWNGQEADKVEKRSARRKMTLETA